MFKISQTLCFITFLTYFLRHLLSGLLSDPGNMWAQSWVNLEDLVKPYPEASEVDITGALVANNYTVLKMFDVADEFYTSLGLESNAVSYNTTLGAMIEKPTDGREVLCHASAWDFCDKETFRSVHIIQVFSWASRSKLFGIDLSVTFELNECSDAIKRV